jgi:hypothetical protein
MRSVSTCAVCCWVVSLLVASCGGGGGGEASPVTPPTAPTAPVAPVSPTPPVTPVAGPTSTAQILGGNNQSGTVKTALPQALAVQLLDAQGRAVPGQTVGFQVTSGGGSVFAGAGTSDALGQVRERWTLGAVAGEQRLQVRMVDSNGTPLVLATFVANATAGAPASLQVLSGTAQAGFQLQALPQPVKFLVKDSEGNPKPGATVRLLVDNGGTVEPPIAITDAQGEISTRWTLGLAFGYHNLNAEVEGLPSVYVRADVLQAPSSGVPGGMLLLEGSGQTVEQHALLTFAQQLRVAVVDARGLRVPEVEVLFSAAPGSGYVTPARVRTNAQGEALWSGYLHTAGSQQVQAAAAGVSPVLFNLNVTPSPYTFDGSYGCTVPPQTSQLGAQVNIRSGAVGPYLSGSSGTLNSTTGAITIVDGNRFGNITARFIGVISVDADQRATISGSGFSYRSTIGPNATIVITETNEGPWTCVRR